MKKLYLLLSFLCFFIVLKAQESKTVAVTAGNLSSLLTSTELSTITDLTLTGTMNAPDFGFLSSMPLLAELDLSGVTITPFHIEIMRYDIYYPENTIPGYLSGYSTDYSFRNMTNLTSIILPSTTTMLGSNAFEGCTSLTNIVIPSSVISINDYVFKDCKSLTSITIPSSVVDLGYGLFSGCSSLASVELPEGIITLGGTFEECTSLRNIKLPVSLKEIGSETFLNCSSLTGIEIPSMVTSIGSAAFSGCTALSAASLSPSLKSIGYYAFSGCIGLTSVTIPSSVTYIGPAAFGGCRSLETIYAFPVQPPQKEDPGYEDAFTDVDKVNCLLYVPVGSKELYAQADDWKGFNYILEMESLRLSVNYLMMETGSGTASVEVTSANAWTATSDQPWLTISPASGTGSSAVTVSVTANPTVFKRMAIATFTAGNQAPQLITVVQQGNKAVIELTAGNLNSTFTAVELKGIQRLTIIGTMDARDFKTIRDKMNTLTELDLSEVNVLAYSGNEGTRNSQYIEAGDTIVESFDYPANEVPSLAFYGNCKLITSGNLPTSITSIGFNAFTQRTLLSEVTIPSTVSYIGPGAFAECASLTSVTLPPRITQISHSLFYQSGLTSINIPSTVSSIEHIAFGNCDSLTSIHSDALFPPELTSQYSGVQVFFDLDKSKCTLYVPYESGELYATAPNEWNEFTNIVEMPGFRLSAVTTAMQASQGDTASVNIKSNVPWTVTSDQSWLTIQPTSGTGNGSLHFTVEANTVDAGRMTIVTVTATDVSPQTITVIQQGASSTVRLTPGSLASAFTAETLSGITDLTITGEMDARDFRVLRDQMPLLTALDLSAVTIKEYKETDPLTKVLTT
ncbi:MAG TPA: leucine-rich repeat protein, partial [Prolixibacteraceae bacterium]|nr:leucine-rich repeat protein [Prolixibacteraceae bacterium]